MQSHSVRFSSRIESRVDPTEEGIHYVDCVDGIGSRPTEELDEDSDFDENEEILDLERRGFDDVEGIEFDLE